VLADFSEPILEAARKRFAAQTGALHFVNVDYGAASWTQSVGGWGPYDAIVSGYSIHHQLDDRKREVYGEIFGLLRPSGIFVGQGGEHPVAGRAAVRMAP
jgi:tRNA (cmo5U34)-methyltransferase